MILKKKNAKKKEIYSWLLSIQIQGPWEKGEGSSHKKRFGGNLICMSKAFAPHPLQLEEQQ